MKIDELKSIPLLTEVDNDILLLFLGTRQIYETNYTKSSTVYGQSDGCVTLDIVISGSLVGYSLSPNGSETGMFEFFKGNIIGANLMFGDSNTYPLNIYCLTDCKLLHLTKAAVLELLKNYGFVMQYIKSLSQNAQGMNLKIAMFTQKSLRENILDYLLAQTAQQQSATITLPITKKQLADYFGVQRPSLFRELKKLSDEKIISIDNRKITINNH